MSRDITRDSSHVPDGKRALCAAESIVTGELDLRS
jgi:hypothetical protein